MAQVLLQFLSPLAKETGLLRGAGSLKLEEGIAVIMVNAWALTGVERLKTQLVDGDIVIFSTAISGG